MNDHPAIALIEYSSITVGTRAGDAMVKKAPITIVREGTFQPGRFAVLFSGDEASVDESFVEGVRVGADAVVDRVILPHVDRSVYRAILGGRGDWSNEALGIIETSTLAATIEAADAAVKGANVEMIEIRLGDGLGGKGLAHFGGLRADVEAAIEIGTSKASREGRQVCSTIISRLDGDLRSALERSTRFVEGW
ncbi:MAG: BMC domain-containing protein [Phycisphaerae bacterium]|nr:BMC domain-containing protein [Phycisphaerae bacterium]